MNYFKLDENNKFNHLYNFDITNVDEDEDLFLIFSDDDLKELKYEINEYLIADRNHMEMYYGLNFSKEFEQIGTFNTYEEFLETFEEEDMILEFIFYGDKNDMSIILDNIEEKDKTIITNEDNLNLDNYLDSFNIIRNI